MYLSNKICFYLVLHFSICMLRKWTLCFFSAVISLEILTVEKRSYILWNYQNIMFNLICIALRSDKTWKRTSNKYIEICVNTYYKFEDIYKFNHIVVYKKFSFNSMSSEGSMHCIVHIGQKSIYLKVL